MPWMRCPNFSARTLTVADSARNFMETLKNVIADDQVTVTMKTNERQSLASPVRSDIMNSFERIADTMRPGVVTRPSRVVSTTDARYLHSFALPGLWPFGFVW